MSLAAADLDRLQRLIEANPRILIFGHKDADGDTLGCSLAFAEALEHHGKAVHVVIPPPLPAKYDWMPGYGRIAGGPPAGTDVGLVLFFDSGNLERSGGGVSQIADHATIVNVDHHASNSRYGDLNLIDAGAAAVGQMCMEILDHFGWEITQPMASNLYTALMTDTGGFRHENTDARALADGARLAALGADPSGVATAVYKSRPLTTLRLTGLAIGAIRVEMSGRLAHGVVTRRMLHEAGAVMSEAEGIIDTVNSIAGIQVGILFKEVGDRLTKVSVRTRGPVDAAALCGRFGGGGHFRAAGAELALPVGEAVESFLAAARLALE